MIRPSVLGYLMEDDSGPSFWEVSQYLGIFVREFTLTVSKLVGDGCECMR